MHRRQLLISGGLLPLSGLLQAAEPFPAKGKTIKAVIPSTAGTATDVGGRVFSTKLAELAGIPVVNDNRPGAGTSIAVEYVSKAPRDGYTLVYGGIASHVVNPLVFTNIKYDPINSFENISTIGTLCNVVVCNNDLPVKNLGELTALLKKNPGKYSYSTPGNATSPHLTGAYYALESGVNMVQVPYKGGAAAVTDLIGGSILIGFDNLGSLLPMIQTGKIRALAVSSKTRSPLLPNVPTFAEQGLKNFEVRSWLGLMLPKNTDAAVVRQYSSWAKAILSDPKVIETLRPHGFETLYQTPAEFNAFIQADIQKYKDIITRAKITVG